MALFLGKTAARPGALKIKLNNYLDRSFLPTYRRYGNLAAWDTWNWGMLGNDTASCCVWSGFAHQIMAWRGMFGDDSVQFTDAQILGPGAYGSTGYNGDPSTDNGTDMATACQFWKDNTLFGHTIQGFAEVQPADVPMAGFIFGSVGIGVKLTQTNIDQFKNNEPWDVADDQNYIGGHYIPGIAINSVGNVVCVSWGRPQAMTPAFLEAQCDEAVVQVAEDWLDAQEDTPRGLKLNDLVNDMASLANT